MSAAPSLRSLRAGLQPRQVRPVRQDLHATGSVNDAPIRHSSCAPVAAASRHSFPAGEVPVRQAQHPLAGRTGPAAARARVFSARGEGPVAPRRPAPASRTPPAPAAAPAGTRPRSRLPSAVLVDGPPNALPVRLLILRVQRRAIQPDTSRSPRQPRPPARTGRRGEPGAPARTAAAAARRPAAPWHWIAPPPTAPRR